MQPTSILVPDELPTPTYEKFLTARDVANALGVPLFKVRRAVKRSQFPVYRIGNGRALLRLSEVVAVVECSASEPLRAAPK